MSRPPALRLACECGRNLADVKLTGMWNPPLDPFELSRAQAEVLFQHRLLVTARPGVRQAAYHRERKLVHAAWPEGQPSTYAWDCRCGKHLELREERIAAMWRAAEPGRLTRFTVGRDDV